MAQQQEQSTDLSQSANASPAVEASLAAHDEIYAPTAVDQDAKPADQSGNISDNGSSNPIQSGTDALSALDSPTPGSDKTFFSPEEQAARQLRGVFASAEMGISDVEHGLSSQSVLHNGTHFDYHPGERADGLTSASRLLVDGGQQLSKTFDARDDSLTAEIRFESKSESSIARQYETGRGPGGLTEESYRRAQGEEDSFRKFANRSDGLSSESYSNVAGIKQYERVFEAMKGPNGLLSDAKIRTADDTIDMELRKYDPKINKDGLAFESVSNEKGAQMTNRYYEGRADGLNSENTSLANGKAVVQKEFANGEKQIKRRYI